MKLWLALGGVLGGCGCPATACRAESELWTTTSMAPEAMSGASLTFCLNSLCESGAFGQVDTAQYVGLELAGGCVSVALTSGNPGSTFTFALLAGTGCPGPELAVGDRVKARLVDANGAVIFDKAHTLELQQVDDSCSGACNRLDLRF